MIVEIDSKSLWENDDINIIFNPVPCSNKGQNKYRFNNFIKKNYNKIYEDWEGYIVGENPDKLLSDIQLVKISNHKFVLNAFCFDKKGDLNLLALTKTFVELFNLSEEYHLNIGIPFHLNLRNKFITTTIDLIIHTIFDDCKSDVYYPQKIIYSTKNK